LQDITNMLACFTLPDAPYTERVSMLTQALSYPGVKIAKVSKWICFIDQRRYAIYDSRVSVALRGVMIDTAGGQSHRAFPLIGRRAALHRVPFRQDSLSATPLRMARAFLDYIDVLQLVSAQTGMFAAEIEMALFMAGNVGWGGEHVPPLQRKMWC
jgi:hypothetical protein